MARDVIALLASFVWLLRAVVVGTVMAQPSAPVPGMTAAECEVWARERSFARALADHDAAAFAEHIHPGAVFIDGTRPLRGRETVASEWAALVKGGGVRLGWHPDRVVIGGDPDLALSMGPAWLEDPRPGANPRFRAGRFISTWRRGADGTWRVLFDGGGGARFEPASADDIAELAASLPATCPRG